jgi:valyl-tRNA synthetase
VEAPALSANVTLPGIEVFVDLAGLIDLEAEVAKTKQRIEKREGRITPKRQKLENANFVRRAPGAVVQQERDSLAELLEMQAKDIAALAAMEDRLQRAQSQEGSDA